MDITAGWSKGGKEGSSQPNSRPPSTHAFNGFSRWLKLLYSELSMKGFGHNIQYTFVSTLLIYYENCLNFTQKVYSFDEIREVYSRKQIILQFLFTHNKCLLLYRTLVLFSSYVILRWDKITFDSAIMNMMAYHWKVFKFYLCQGSLFFPKIEFFIKAHMWGWSFFIKGPYVVFCSLKTR